MHQLCQILGEATWKYLVWIKDLLTQPPRDSKVEVVLDRVRNLNYSSKTLLETLCKGKVYEKE